MFCPVATFLFDMEEIPGSTLVGSTSYCVHPAVGATIAGVSK